MNYRSRKLLDLAHDMPCMASFPHQCQGKSVPCHANDLLFGRGFAYKAPDWAWCAACPDAHDYIDGRKGGWDKEVKRGEWLRAYVRTQNFLWETGKVVVNGKA